jgi:nicotinamide riboside transporter PnuC
MNPVLHFLDWLIQAHGETLTNLFVYVGLPLIAWFLGRRSARKKIKPGNTFILVVRPPGKTLSPVSRWTFESDDDSGPFGG